MEASAMQGRRGLPLTRSRRMLSVLGDERLVEQIRHGNEVAFEVVFDRYHRGILSFSRHMLGSREEAEDAVQQTFVSAYNDLVSSDRPINLKPWLFTIARNRCLSMLRARREHPAEIPDIATAGLAHEVQQRDDLRELLSDLHGLPEHQRAALILSELGGLSHNDIGTVLEVAPMKVKSLVFQARSSLIETRNAREIPCDEIREQLATLSGGALRRGPLRRHLKTCEGCRRFRDDVRRQRAMMAAILPVVPTVALKKTALAAAGIGGGKAGGGLVAAAGAGKAATGGAAAASGGAAASGAGGGIASLVAGGTAAKVATVAVLAGGSAAGGVAITDGGGGEPRARSDTPAAQERQSAAGEGESSGPGGSGSAPGLGAPADERDSGSGDGARRTGSRKRGARGRLTPGERRDGSRRDGKGQDDPGQRRTGGRREGDQGQRGTGGRRGAGRGQGQRQRGSGTRRNADRTPPARRRRTRRPRSPQRPPVRVPDPAPETDSGSGYGGATDSTREQRQRPPRTPRADDSVPSA